MYEIYLFARDSSHVILFLDVLQYLVSECGTQNMCRTSWGEVGAINGLGRGTIAKGDVLRPCNRTSPNSACRWGHKGLVQLLCTSSLLHMRLWPTPRANDHDGDLRVVGMAARTQSNVQSHKQSVTPSQQPANLLHALHILARCPISTRRD